MTSPDIPAPFERIILPLDGMSLHETYNMIDRMRDAGITSFKVGKSLINSGRGGEVAREIQKHAGRVFWDNKDEDIGTTMLDAGKSANAAGFSMYNVLASAGPKKLAQVAAEKGNGLILAVTVLTDLDDEECEAIFGKNVRNTVLKFARWVEAAGLDGIICSPADLDSLKKAKVGQDLLKVCPGVRPPWAAANDQKRITTPAQAINLGADYLVIGRPITQPPEEVGSSDKAVELIVEEITTARAAKEAQEA